MAWIIMVNGASLAAKVTDPQKSRSILEASAEYIALSSEAKAFGLLSNIDAHCSEDNEEILSVSLGVELLPDRYIARGETLVADYQSKPLPENFEDLVMQLRVIVQGALHCEFEVRRGIVLNHFD